MIRLGLSNDYFTKLWRTHGRGRRVRTGKLVGLLQPSYQGVTKAMWKERRRQTYCKAAYKVYLAPLGGERHMGESAMSPWRPQLSVFGNWMEESI